MKIKFIILIFALITLTNAEKNPMLTNTQPISNVVVKPSQLGKITYKYLNLN